MVKFILILTHCLLPHLHPRTHNTVVVVLKNGPNTPLIQPKKFSMPANYRVSKIMEVLREKLQLPPEESLVSTPS